ncbi:MAG: outer membrane protein assembly factor BamB family protein [Anaerolineae bacterium]
MIQSRIIGAAIGLLLLCAILTACRATPVAENWPGLTVTEGTVMAISGVPQQVYLLDAKTGVQKLVFMPQTEGRGTVYWSPVTVGGDLAFVGVSTVQPRKANLYAFDPNTGQELWHVSANDLILAAPTYAEGVVYFGDSSGQVYAVAVESRNVKPGWPFQAKEGIWASPLVANGRVYVGSMDHHLYCLDAETGEKLWNTPLGGAIAAQPTLDAARGVIYVGAFNGQVYAVRADSGEIVQEFQFKANGWIWSEVLVAEDRLYVTSLDGKLYALDPSSGSVLPPYPYDSGEIDGKKESIRAAPIRAGDLIIIATKSGRLIAVKEGQRQWYWPSGTPQASILTTPVFFEGSVYAILMNGNVQTLNAETGVPGWGFSSPGK